MCHKTKINFNSFTGSFYLCIFSHSIPRGWYVPYNKNWFQFFDWIFLFMYLQSLILYPVVDMSHTTKINFNSLTGSFYLCIFSHYIPRGWYVPYNKNRFQFFDWIFLFMYLQKDPVKELKFIFVVWDISTTGYRINDWRYINRKIQSKNWNLFLLYGTYQPRGI